MVVSSRRAKVVWSSANDLKERLAATTTITGDKLKLKLNKRSKTKHAPNLYNSDQTTYCKE